MGEISKIEEFFNSAKHSIACVFGRHDFDVHEVLIYGHNHPIDEARIYVSCCPWCGKMMYGAKP